MTRMTDFARLLLLPLAFDDVQNLQYAQRAADVLYLLCIWPKKIRFRGTKNHLYFSKNGTFIFGQKVDNRRR